MLSALSAPAIARPTCTGASWRDSVDVRRSGSGVTATGLSLFFSTKLMSVHADMQLQAEPLRPAVGATRCNAGLCAALCRADAPATGAALTAPVPAAGFGEATTDPLAAAFDAPEPMETAARRKDYARPLKFKHAAPALPPARRARCSRTGAGLREPCVRGARLDRPLRRWVLRRPGCSKIKSARTNTHRRPHSSHARCDKLTLWQRGALSICRCRPVPTVRAG